MRERMEKLGGTLTVESRIGEGTQVIARLNLKP
jgi:signal transduction histidine kinase